MVSGREGEERWFCGKEVLVRCERREGGRLLLGLLSEPNLVRKPPRERDSGSVAGCGERTPTSRLTYREGLGNCSSQPEAAGDTLWNVVTMRL